MNRTVYKIVPHSRLTGRTSLGIKPVLCTYQRPTNTLPTPTTVGDDRANQLMMAGLLREHTHNHPDSDLAPSNPSNSKNARNDYKSRKAVEYWERRLGVKYPCTFKIYGKKQGMYRTYDGDMLDSRVNKKGRQYKIQNK